MAEAQTTQRLTADASSNRVFITHEKQKAIVNQIMELLTFGSFEPVVSVERESTAIPVPEKVFEDMRACAASVIQVGSEGKYLDRDGAEHTKINDNVLIEIGAAMALYGKKVILLVERGVSCARCRWLSAMPAIAALCLSQAGRQTLTNWYHGHVDENPG